MGLRAGISGPKRQALKIVNRETMPPQELFLERFDIENISTPCADFP